MIANRYTLHGIKPRNWLLSIARLHDLTNLISILINELTDFQAGLLNTDRKEVRAHFDPEDILSNDVNPEDLRDDVKLHIDLLIELGPLLQENLQFCNESAPENTEFSSQSARLSDPARKYASIIRDRFPNADEALIFKLGEANWRRHLLVREKIFRKTASTKLIRSVHETSSTFEDSGIGKSIPTDVEEAISQTSLNSSVASQAETSLRVPPMPPQITSGSPFVCSFCRKKVKIANRASWKFVILAPE